ncbi:accessory gene regulator B family protein [Paenibacillus sp. FSL M8-0142]|uniref:accessory gene regulator B family protein n=1 Tax=Paenibacillus sp. FSL M8-0142 TaxID=2954525 RepID=UPI003159CE82
MLLEETAKRIAERIKRQVPDHKSTLPVLAHAVAIVLNVVLIVSLTMLIAWFTGNTGKAALSLIGFAVLRQFSGGMHLKSGAACIAVTTGLFTLVSFLEPGLLYIQLLNLASLLLVIRFAPSRIKDQSRISSVHYPKLRLISCLIVAVNIVIQSPTLAIVFFIQAVSLVQWRGGGSYVPDRQSETPLL